MGLFERLLAREHALFAKTERLKRALADSFAGEVEQINFCRQLFDSVSAFAKPLETRGFGHYLDPKYQRLLGGHSRFTQRALDLKGLNDEVRAKHGFPVLTFKELHVLALHYNVSRGDSVYLQEFMFILLGAQLMFRFFETVD